MPPIIANKAPGPSSSAGAINPYTVVGGLSTTPIPQATSGTPKADPHALTPSTSGATAKALAAKPSILNGRPTQSTSIPFVGTSVQAQAKMPTILQPSRAALPTILRPPTSGPTSAMPKAQVSVPGSSLNPFIAKAPVTKAAMSTRVPVKAPVRKAQVQQQPALPISISPFGRSIISGVPAPQQMGSSIQRFGNGVWVNRPTIGVIGEREDEVVVPARVLRNEKALKKFVHERRMHKNVTPRSQREESWAPVRGTMDGYLGSGYSRQRQDEGMRTPRMGMNIGGGMSMNIGDREERYNPLGGDVLGSLGGRTNNQKKKSKKGR